MTNRCEYCGHEEQFHGEDVNCTECDKDDQVCVKFIPDVFHMWGDDEEDKLSD